RLPLPHRHRVDARMVGLGHVGGVVHADHRDADVERFEPRHPGVEGEQLHHQGGRPYERGGEADRIADPAGGRTLDQREHQAEHARDGRPDHGDQQGDLEPLQQHGQYVPGGLPTPVHQRTPPLCIDPATAMPPGPSPVRTLRTISAQVSRGGAAWPRRYVAAYSISRITPAMIPASTKYSTSTMP